MPVPSLCAAVIPTTCVQVWDYSGTETMGSGGRFGEGHDTYPGGFMYFGILPWVSAVLPGTNIPPKGYVVLHATASGVVSTSGGTAEPGAGIHMLGVGGNSQFYPGNPTVTIDFDWITEIPFGGDHPALTTLEPDLTWTIYMETVLPGFAVGLEMSVSLQIVGAGGADLSGVNGTGDFSCAEFEF